MSDETRRRQPSTSPFFHHRTGGTCLRYEHELGGPTPAAWQPAPGAVPRAVSATRTLRHPKRARLDPEPRDAVEDLRRGWDTVVEFGISRPELFAVMDRATGRGAVTTWHSTPADRRGDRPRRGGPRAALPDDAGVLRDAEQSLLREWLTRLAADSSAPRT
ncbi:hypothetical protein [Streptomyces sp. NPDC001037]|uniref:hypothetical protein n=1 Tax=Streptomyces sp. NPDC001037 TaxID=3364542 RepID=UPI0036C5F5C3